MLALVAGVKGAERREVRRPLPLSGQVVVRVACAGLCRTDVSAARGLIPVSPGRILGHEVSGTVTTLGQRVSRELLGQKVAVFPWLGCGVCAECQRDELQTRCASRRFLGLDVDGAFAPEVVLPADRCFPVSEGMSDVAAAYAEPVAAALGVCALLPAEVEVGVLGGGRLAELARRLLIKAGHSVAEEPLENSLNWVLETSAATVERAMSVLRPGGTLVVKSRPASAVPWPLRLQVEKELRVVAAGYGSFRRAITLLQGHPQLFEDLWDEPRPLADWAEALEAETAGAERRKIFFRPDSLS